MAYEVGFFYCFHSVENIFLYDAVATEVVNSEIADTEGGEVLEEVGSLRRIYTIVLQSLLHDDSCRRDVRPFHGDAQPVVAGAPTSGTYEDVVLATLKETTVYLLYLVGYLRIVHGGEIVAGLDIYHVKDVLGNAVS